MSLTRRDFCRLALAAGIIPASWAQQVLGQETAPATGKNSVLLTLLHTNDPHGRVLLPGQTTGLARIASLIRQVRAEMPNVLLLEAGDMIHGTPEEKEFEGKPIINALNALNYDVATAGNHEFDFGQRITEQALKLANFPVLSANVLDEKTGKPWGELKPYIIREVQGIRIAIFGLTTVDTVKIQFPRTLQGIRFADPTETARELVPRLRQEERADVVIFLSHLGYLPDKAMAEAVPDIDIILGGHSHTKLAEQVWVNGTLINQTGCFNQALGRTDLLIERDAQGKAHLTINGRDNKWWGHGGVPAPLGKTYPTGPLIIPTAETPNDPAILAVYTPYRESITKRGAEVLTTAAEPLTAEGVKKGETALGNLLADAVRKKFQVDVGVIPSSAITGTLPAGPITVAQAIDTIGGYTRQHVVTARVPGAQLRAFCERTLKPAAWEMQISGLTRQAGVISVNGQPLRDEAMYTVAGAAYLIQSQLLSRDEVVIVNDDPEAPTTREAIVELLRGHEPLKNRLENKWSFA